MWHLIFVTLHAVCATAALVLGVLALRHQRLMVAHLAGVAGMAGCLPLSIAAGWSGFIDLTRTIFIGLFVLSLVMLVQAFWARRAQRAGNEQAAIGHLGFNVIALVTGFLAVAVLRTGAGVIGVVIVAVVTPLLGHLIVKLLQRKLDPRRRAATPDSARQPAS